MSGNLYTGKRVSFWDTKATKALLVAANERQASVGDFPSNRLLIPILILIGVNLLKLAPSNQEDQRLKRAIDFASNQFKPIKV